MNEMTIRQIAERAYPEENLNWSVSSIIPNPKEPKQWEIYYDAWPGNYHRILFRSRPQTDPTGNALNAALRDFRRDLKERRQIMKLAQKGVCGQKNKDS